MSIRTPGSPRGFLMTVVSDGIWAVLLAAGLSTRMGQPKALLPWMGSTLVERQLEQLGASRVDGVVVVLGHEAEEVMGRVTGRMGVKVTVNRDYERGRASSVVLGVKATPVDATAILILNVDQPRPAWLIDEVVDAHLRGSAKITIPVHRSRRGHPTALDGSLREEMLGITEEGLGLKEVVRRDGGRVGNVEVSSSLICLDMNTPEEYREGLGRVEEFKGVGCA